MRTVLAVALSLSSSFASAQPKAADKAAPPAAKPAEPPGQAKKAEPAAAPAAGAKMEMPKPAEEMSVEKWFVGKWSCDGSQTETPMGPAGKYTNALEVKSVLGGWWIMFSVDRKKGVPPMGNTIAGFAGFDAAGKKHVRSDFSLGASTTQLTATGWEGDKLVFSGDQMMMGKKMPVRHTFTKKSDKEFQSVFEITGPDGKMATWIDETCKKQGK